MTKSEPDPDRVDARQLALRITQEIEQIPGVLAAAVSLVEPARVRAVYIAAATGTSISTVQKAATEILGRSGLIFSTDAIHVGVLNEAADLSQGGHPAEAPALVPIEGPVPPPWQGRFLVLGNLEVHRAQNRVTCRVQLLRLEETFTGEAHELDTRTGRARAAARATLQAAEQAADGSQLSLEGVILTELFGRTHVVVSIEAASARRIANLPGIVAVQHSIEDATCLATLGAIERWLAW